MYDILPQQTSRLANEDGILLSSFSLNKNEISRHESLTVHKALIERMKEDQKYTLEELTPVINFQEDPRLVVTNRVVRSVYQSVKSGVSLNNMRHFIQLQRTHGKTWKVYFYTFECF